MATRFAVEGGEYGTLDLGESRIGRITVQNARFEALNLERALAVAFDIEPSGRILAAGGGYPQGGYKT